MTKQNCPPIGWQNGTFENQASHPFKCSPLAWQSWKPGSCSNVGQLRSFQTLVFPPHATSASFTPLHWKMSGGRFFEIMKTTFTGPLHSSVKRCHQCDKMTSKSPSFLTQTMLWFWLSLSVRLSLIAQRYLKEYISYYLEAEHYNSLQTHVSFMWCTICKYHLGPIFFLAGSEVCQRGLPPNPQRAHSQTKVRRFITYLNASLLSSSSSSFHLHSFSPFRFNLVDHADLG